MRSRFIGISLLIYLNRVGPRGKDRYKIYIYDSVCKLYYYGMKEICVASLLDERSTDEALLFVRLSRSTVTVADIKCSKVNRQECRLPFEPTMRFDPEND